MVTGKRIVVALIILVALAGFYMIFSSDKVELDPFNLVIFFMLLAFVIYVFLLSRRNQ